MPIWPDYNGSVDSGDIVDGSIVNADVSASAAIDATKIHDGSISNTEFGYLNNVSSNIQTQLDGKQALDSDLTSWAAVTRASGFDTFAATPSSANLAALVTDETGSGSLVFSTNPALTGPTVSTYLNMANLSAIRTSGQNATDRVYFQAYDSIQAQYETVAMLGNDAGTPFLELYSPYVTLDGNTIYTVTGQDVSLADGGTGASLSDPNADKIMFWDDSAGAVTWLAPITTNIISTTNLQLASGTYTPTLTDVTNIQSHGSVSDANYMRVGNTVTVSGRISIDPTSGSVASEIGISLPIASNFTLFTDCSGMAFCGDIVSLGAQIRADTTNDRAQMRWVHTADTSAREWSYHFTYTIY